MMNYDEGAFISYKYIKNIITLKQYTVQLS